MTAGTKTPCTDNPLCIAGKEHEPLLKNLRQGLIDPDTPESAKTRTSHNGKTQKLVFSDEFNTAGRTFYDGDDPFFQAVDIWYGATQDLEVSLQSDKLGASFSRFPVVRTRRSLHRQWHAQPRICQLRQSRSQLSLRHGSIVEQALLQGRPSGG